MVVDEGPTLGDGDDGYLQLDDHDPYWLRYVVGFPIESHVAVDGDGCGADLGESACIVHEPPRVLWYERSLAAVRWETSPTPDLARPGLGRLLSTRESATPRLGRTKDPAESGYAHAQGGKASRKGSP